MSFFKDWVFNRLPKVIQFSDTNLNANGDGTLKRYLQTMGIELDDNFLPFIQNFNKLIDVIQVDDKFLPLLGGILGYPPAIVIGDNDFYRKVLAYAVAIYKIKGTLRSFQILFNLLGLSITIKEDIPKKRVTYDMDPLAIYDEVPPNIYDSECDYCSGYWILWEVNDIPCNVFDTADALDDGQLEIIENIICFLSPINAVFNGMIKQLKACDTLDLGMNDLSNFCDHPTDLNVTWDDESMEATVTWLGEGDFQLKYRLYPDGDFGDVIDPASSPTILSGLTVPNTLYEIQVRKICDDSNSIWVSVYLLTGSGIVNVSNHDIFPSGLQYIPHFDKELLVDYSIFLDFTTPLDIVSLTDKDGVIIGPGVVSSLSQFLTWFNTHFDGGLDDAGNVVSTGNTNGLSKITYRDGLMLIDVFFSGRNAYEEDLVADYYIKPDFTDGITIETIVIRGETNSIGLDFTNASDMVDWLNGFGWGTFDIDGDGYIRVLNSTIVLDKLIYSITGGDGTLLDLLWDQRNRRLTDTSIATLIGDYAFSMDFTDPVNVTALVINNISVPGPGVISNMSAMLAWLNGLNLGSFTAQGSNVLAINNPNTIYQIFYDGLVGIFNQTNLRLINSNPNGTIIMFPDGFVMHNGDVFASLIPAGLYDLIRIILPIETNSIPLDGGVLYTPGSGPYVGFIDNNDLVFTDVNLGSSFEIVLL